MFDKAEFPTSWCKSIIVTLSKKGDANSSDNYRGISLLTIFSKIYTSIISRRVTFYTNIYNKISESQAGFCEGYSTIDNAFILYSLIHKYLSKKRGKLYVAFVDFRKLPSIYVFSYFPFGFEGRMWDLIVSVPDHCLSFYFT